MFSWPKGADHGPLNHEGQVGHQYTIADGWGHENLLDCMNLVMSGHDGKEK